MLSLAGQEPVRQKMKVPQKPPPVSPTSQPGQLKRRDLLIMQNEMFENPSLNCLDVTSTETRETSPVKVPLNNLGKQFLSLRPQRSEFPSSPAEDGRISS